MHVSRVSASYTYPADFCLIAAPNPCPCGYYGDQFCQSRKYVDIHAEIIDEVSVTESNKKSGVSCCHQLRCDGFLPWSEVGIPFPERIGPVVIENLSSDLQK